MDQASYHLNVEGFAEKTTRQTYVGSLCFFCEREIEEEHRRIAFGEGSYELLYSETP
jgi:hypothetical protein